MEAQCIGPIQTHLGIAFHLSFSIVFCFGLHQSEIIIGKHLSEDVTTRLGWELNHLPSNHDCRENGFEQLFHSGDSSFLHQTKIVKHLIQELKNTAWVRFEPKPCNPGRCIYDDDSTATMVLAMEASGKSCLSVDFFIQASVLQPGLGSCNQGLGAATGAWVLQPGLGCCNRSLGAATRAWVLQPELG